MTGGRVVILGDTGRNFAAGMSGGVAYIWDPDNKFSGNFNGELCDLLDVKEKSDTTELKKIIKNHHLYTQSEESIKQFKKILPREYAKIINSQSKNGTSKKQIINNEKVIING